MENNINYLHAQNNEEKILDELLILYKDDEDALVHINMAINDLPYIRQHKGRTGVKQHIETLVAFLNDWH